MVMEHLNKEEEDHEEEEEEENPVKMKKFSDLGLNPGSFEKLHRSIKEEEESEDSEEYDYAGWINEMNSGFNVLLYGIGSKIRVLDGFVHECTKRKGACPSIIRVKGYNRMVHIKDILSALFDKWIPLLVSSLGGLRGIAGIGAHHHRNSNIQDQCETLIKISNLILKSTPSTSTKESLLLMSPHLHVILVIDNIDGRLIRDSTTQQALGVLALSPLIHILASVDHIHASFMWDHVESERFNWIFHECSTMKLHIRETQSWMMMNIPPPPPPHDNDDNDNEEEEEEEEEDGTNYVLTSLTRNHREVFKLIAQLQLNSKTGIEFRDLYRECKEKLIVSNDSKLRSILIYLNDQALVVSSQTSKGQRLHIPRSTNALRKALLLL